MNSFKEHFSALFSLGFRPFFLLSSAYAAVSVILWGLFFSGFTAWQPAWSNVLLWHGFEMVFGFTLAIIAGFLLTAVPNWTKGRAFGSWRLVAMCFLWLAGRVSMYFEPLSAYAPAINIAFPIVLAITISIPLFKNRSLRNLPFVLMLLVLGILGGIIQVEGLELENIWLYSYLNSYIPATNALLATVFIIMTIVSIIGGRIIPLFTANTYKVLGMDYHKFISPKFSLLCNFSVAAIVPAMMFYGIDAIVTGVLSIFSALLHGLRFALWQNKLAHWKWPLVWVLHIGYAWLVVGLFLLGVNSLLLDGYNSTAFLHVLTIGVIGTLTMGMMTRVSLGHTGRDLSVPLTMVIAYLLIQASLVSRVFLWNIDFIYSHYMATVSAIFWSIAFLIFFIKFGHVLVSPRADRGR